MVSIVTWNINSVRLRMPIVERFLKEHAPDILCLQEIKCQEHQFPYDEPELVFLPIHSGSSSYLSWLREQVSPLPRGVRGQRASNSARKEIED